MQDEKFDKLIKKHIQEDEYITEKINQLFSNFERNVNNMEEKSKKFKFSNYLKTISVAACSMLVIFVGGCTYAHVNGRETIISPLLRNLGINSKYEENATQFNDEIAKKDVKIKMLDGAIDDTTFIVGYEIEIANNNPDAWIEVNGEYKINDIGVKPISTTIDKLSDTTYIYYQVFDVNEIKNVKNVKVNANIYEIKQYTEGEDLDSAYIVYGKTFTDNWNFEENITVKNIEESKVYEFSTPQNYELIKNVNLSVTEFITGSYTNILKVQTDKTNYTGNAFEKYYRILDEQNREISVYSEEPKQYDDRVYKDRLISGNISKNSKIVIEVYFKLIDENSFNKVATIPVDLSKATEKAKTELNLKQYANNDYSFSYNENWTLIPRLDENRVGPNSIYLGALSLEIPSTTNSDYASSIYVRTINQNTTIEEFAEQIRTENTASPSELYEEKSASVISLKNQSAYQIISETSDGEDIYIKQDIFTAVNGKVYVITFFGTEKEYNNLNVAFSEFIDSFEIK